MKHFSPIYLFLLVMVAPAFAAPTTQPVPDVLIVPFKPLAEPNAQPALGRAIQVNLLADLGHARFHPAQENDLNADPQSAGKSAGARYVISGTWQSAGDLLRFTGEITDVQTGLIVGGLSATGSPRDLFAVEDALSAQAIRQLHQLTTPPSTASPVAAELPLPVPAAVHPYPGSALEAYVNSNRTPSEDYWEQSRSLNDIQRYGFNQPAYFPYYGGYGYGYYGYGVPFYGGFSYGYGLVGAVSFPGRHLPFR